jgi:hypothetical protein
MDYDARKNEVDQSISEDEFSKATLAKHTL